MRFSDNDPWIDPLFEQRVRDTAYFLWEQDGQPDGKELDYWYAALEKCLRGSIEQREGHQLDDNIDDLGRNLNDPNTTLDQPVNSKV